MRNLFLCIIVVGIAFSPINAFAQFEKDKAQGKGIRFGKEVVQRWRVGVKVNANAGSVKGVFITIPIPTEWPEQGVKSSDEDFTKNVNRTKYRFLDGGVKQMLVSVPSVRTGDEARSIVTLEVSSRVILPPKDTSIFVIPKKSPRAILKYLGASPYINCRHSSIRNQAKEIIKDIEGGWKKAEAIYDFTRHKIELGDDNEKLQGALDTLREKKGKGEDKVNLFVALCRAAKIPSRIVWVEGGFYGEVYLNDDDGKGHWLPADVIGNSTFGSIANPKPILQKGDNIKVPEYKERLRYVPELVKGKKGGGKPSVTFVRELLPAN